MMGKLPLGVVSPYVKMSSGGCSDPLKFYATSYCTAYGEDSSMGCYLQDPVWEEGPGEAHTLGQSEQRVTCHIEWLHSLSPRLTQSSWPCLAVPFLGPVTEVCLHMAPVTPCHWLCSLAS